MEIPILSALILLNGVFAMSEIALVTARKARLQVRVNEGDGAAACALRLDEDPTRFLSTIQIGITSIGVLNGIVGEAALAEPLAAWLAALGRAGRRTPAMARPAWSWCSITYFSIVRRRARAQAHRPDASRSARALGGAADQLAGDRHQALRAACCRSRPMALLRVLGCQGWRRQPR